MASNFEQLIFEIIATDRNASAAFDRFRAKVDQTSRSVDASSVKLDKNSKSVDSLGKSAASSTPFLAGMAGAGGMGGMIAAGVALSPVIATVGVGLAGFGAAAYGAISPILKAAQATGGLQANMATLNPEQQQVAKSLQVLAAQYGAFEKTLAPQVLGVFGQGLKLAGHLMADVQPVAKATGIAIDGLLGRIDAEFQSQTWQQFFGFMANTAGPDIKQLGNLIVDLTKGLPSLVMALQPVAHGLLLIADDAAKATTAVAGFFLAEEKRASRPGSFGTQISDFLKYGYAGHAGAVAAQAQATAQAALNKRLLEAGTATADLIHPMGTYVGGLVSARTAAANAATATANLAATVTMLTTAMTANVTAVLTLQGDQIAWKQALHAATAQLASNSAGLTGNSVNALANKAAVLASTNAVVTFASNQLTLHGNLQLASQEIQAQIKWLQQHGDKSKFAAAEIKALRKEEALIRAQIKSNIIVSGTGKWSVSGGNTYGGSRPGATGGGGPAGQPAAAQGMLVRGGIPGRDSVLLKAMPGELVVPTHMVNAGLVNHLRGRIPGFATGGIVGGYNGPPNQAMGQWAVSNWQATIHQIQAATAAATFGGMQAAAAAAMAAFGGARGSGGPASGAVGALQRYAASLFGQFGWGANQLGPLIALWNGESGWNPNARNPSSGAFGIPQALPPGKMGALAASGNAAAQIRWGEGYIHSVYGTPGNAYGTWLSRSPHWYDNSGWLPPGPSLAYNGTGRPEAVVGGGPLDAVVAELRAVKAELRAMHHDAARAPAQTGAAVTGGINNGARAAARAAYYSPRPR